MPGPSGRRDGGYNRALEPPGSSFPCP